MILDAKYLGTPYRCAVYFVPDPDSVWWDAGSSWLGRCAATSQPVLQPLIDGVSSKEQWALTAEPRRYGWHATLKAPFKIVPGIDLRSVMLALREIGKSLPAFDLPAMKVSTDGGYMALRPQDSSAEIQRAGDACVTGLHQLAVPLGESELARRRMAQLTPLQDQLLQVWGYPYVLDEFSFHLSLTGRLDNLSKAQLAQWQEAAMSHFGHLPACRFDRLALFVEPERGADFQLFDQVLLTS
ncbi:MAG: hypothetical protein B7Y59_07495 [Burkholderiales bacterium 35-55-47]|jgi:hypothetical protein|uniref:DUF1045 domain-containing protein n=1 Tax=Limnohabitans sp. TaxID=1907725 RepID=UPI000BCFF408|nr:DUF1045 domain-containing protein [Limnohabitans sp.]OYY18927.1 MAG: hypothetical protein B7Y59_07495 [Burkholderiales bacterium 35-55-47]OYZ73745.1 MAG: hypothetical protein B7Y06_06925 [Burkholderiales bacterium 24-55-52]OZB00890.1 MAG: hypothetical protein B7X62_06940 [Burkholderiales bacterium 39-55-53]HQR85322.1 DUF1045 domain-containing protein [Limnohabitans sp.]HQS27270.1 DUF1045 domain-containing protein [Limnohabitans sp.]